MIMWQPGELIETIIMILFMIFYVLSGHWGGF